MAIYQILEEIKDVRKEGELCDFNGYLEDYLEVIDSSEDQPMKDILHLSLIHIYPAARPVKDDRKLQTLGLVNSHDFDLSLIHI